MISALRFLGFEIYIYIYTYAPGVVEHNIKVWIERKLRFYI